MKIQADRLMVHIGQLLTMAGPRGPRAGARQGELGLIADGAIASFQDRIVAVGTTSEVMAALELTPGAITQDAMGRVVTPGLVDSHTHLVFAGMRQHEFERRAQGASYAQIMREGGGIHASVRMTRQASFDDLLEQALGHLDTMMKYGTTTVEAKSGYGLDGETELKQLAAIAELDLRHPLTLVPTFMGAHAVPQGQDPDAYVEWLVSTAIPQVAREHLAAFCDVFCEQGAFSPEQSEKVLRAGLAHGLHAKIHADELSDTGGALLAARVGAVSADHLHCASDEGLRAMAAAGVVATVLPGTAVFLGLGEHAPARRMIELGVPVALATDFNPGSCCSENLALMMSFAVTQLKMTPAEALVAATINGAHALARADHLGSLEVGKQADWVLWEAEDYRMIPYRMGVNLVSRVIKAGRKVHAAGPRVAMAPV